MCGSHSSHPLIVSLGEVLWDMLPDGPRAGGAPVNLIYHASKHGACGLAVSAIGNDQLGTDLIGAMDEHGIEHCLERLPYPTGQVLVKLHDGIPRYTILENTAWDHLFPTKEALALTAKADALCFGTLALRAKPSRDTIFNLIKHSKPEAMRYFDINLRAPFYSEELILQLLQLSTAFKCNDEELILLKRMLKLSGDEDQCCRTILERFNLDYVILTAGSRYSKIFSRDDLSYLPTPKVKVADTVGAGDAFSGALAASLLRVFNLRQAHAIAVKTAAFVCTQPGAWPRYPAALV